MNFTQAQVERLLAGRKARQEEVDLLKAELKLWKPKPTTQEEKDSIAYKIIKKAIKTKLKEKRFVGGKKRMSEKVWGFYEKDAFIIEEEAKNWDEGCWETYKYYKISEYDFVPVRLASESVDMEWLPAILADYYDWLEGVKGQTYVVKKGDEKYPRRIQSALIFLRGTKFWAEKEAKK